MPGANLEENGSSIPGVHSALPVCPKEPHTLRPGPTGTRTFSAVPRFCELWGPFPASRDGSLGTPAPSVAGHALPSLTTTHFTENAAMRIAFGPRSPTQTVPSPHLPGAPITRGREQSQDGVDSQKVSSVSAPLQQAAPIGHVSQKVNPGDDTLDSKDGQSLHQFTAARWARIEPLLPSSDGHQGRAFRDNRLVAGGVIYRYRTATAWRDLPDYFSAW